MRFRRQVVVLVVAAVAAGLLTVANAKRQDDARLASSLSHLCPSPTGPGSVPRSQPRSVPQSQPQSLPQSQPRSSALCAFLSVPNPLTDAITRKVHSTPISIARKITEVVHSVPRTIESRVVDRQPILRLHSVGGVANEYCDSDGSTASETSCKVYVVVPLSQRDVPVVLHSDRGARRSAIGLLRVRRHVHVQVRRAHTGAAAGDRECFWLTTSAPGWAPVSNTACMTWPKTFPL